MIGRHRRGPVKRRTAPDADTAERGLEVRFPELPVPAYLRVVAWCGDAMAALLADGSLEAAARANGVRVLDREVQQLGCSIVAAFTLAAARANRAGAATMAPSVTAPPRVWLEGIENAEHLAAWADRLRGSTATGFPLPSREVGSVWSTLLAAARDACVDPS
jgi:hypothetical protein